MIDHADVLRWNELFADVRCPRCKEIHRHHYKSYDIYRSDITYKPECDDPGAAQASEYRLRFPFNEKMDEKIGKKTGDAWYEIDKSMGFFVVAGEEVVEERPDVYVPDSKEMITTWGLEKLGPESLSLESLIKDFGETALHIASCLSDSAILQNLLAKGFDPDAQREGYRGTPLCEAALWGRLENVKLLLRHQAKPFIRRKRNGEWLGPEELAKPSMANSKERYLRSGKHQLYREDPYLRDLDRNEIVRLLSDRAGDAGQTFHAGPDGLDAHVFSKSTDDKGEAGSYTLMAHFQTSRKQQTVGVLWRGSGRSGVLPAISTKSGRSYPSDLENNIVLGNRDWPAAIRRLYMILEDLKKYPDDRIDLDCHVEKQLVAWFASRHLILPKDKEMRIFDDHSDEEVLVARMANVKIEDNVEGEVARKKKLLPGKKIERLETKMPPVLMKKATILVSEPVCDDCRDFIEKFNKKFEVDIRAYHRCLGSCDGRECPSCKPKTEPEPKPESPNKERQNRKIKISGR